MRAPRGHPRKIALVCCRCGRNYFVKMYRAAVSRYCSRACTRIAKRCEWCGELIVRRPGRRRFCSRACAVRFMRGPNASVWKGGSTLKNKRKRLGRALVEWRLAVFKRDAFACQQCGAAGGLHAHHIKSFADFPRLRTRVSNGLTLCEACHGKLHGKTFSHRVRRKTCRDCGARCSGRGSGRCRPCATRRWHALGRPCRAVT
jgi:5-methylcytosine-specific restriction endonuclease McrA